MRFTLDEEVLARYNLRMDEGILLLYAALEKDINETVKSLIDKNFAYKNQISSPNIVLDERQKKLIESVLIDSDNSVKNKDEYYYMLASKLQEVYPKGKKPGTAYPWRGSKAEIAKKLKTLVVKYNYQFTIDQAVKATQEYVNRFIESGDYTNMRLLKYFILKTVSDADGNAEIKSDFMALIDNEDQENNLPDDWINSVR